MATDIETTDIVSTIWERVLRFENGLSATGARELLKLHFPEDDRQRMSDLAAKARAGRLTAAEERETEAYERLGCLLDVLHSHARRAINDRSVAS